MGKRCLEVDYVKQSDRRNPWSLREALLEIMKLKLGGTWTNASKVIKTKKQRRHQPHVNQNVKHSFDDETLKKAIKLDEAELKYWQIESFANSSDIPVFVLLLFSRLRSDYRDVGSQYKYETSNDVRETELEKSDASDDADESIAAISYFIRYKLPDLLLRARSINGEMNTQPVLTPMELPEEEIKRDDNMMMPRGLPLNDLAHWAEEFRQAKESAMVNRQRRHRE